MFRVALWLARGGVRVGGSRPHTVRFPELSLFTVRGVIHGSWCDLSRVAPWSLPLAVLPNGSSVGTESSSLLSPLACTPLRCARYHGLRTMPVDTRRISYAADTQAAGIQPSSSEGTGCLDVK